MPSFRVPWFHPVPVRSRRDGWHPALQARFLAELWLSRSVAAAARKVGRSRESAYRLRARPLAASFARAWDHALGLPVPPPDLRGPKVTQSALVWRVEAGWWRPVIGGGRCIRIAQKPDNSALLQLIARLDRATRRRDQHAGEAEDDFFHDGGFVVHLPPSREGEDPRIRFPLEAGHRPCNLSASGL